jgi:acetylornithine deacetylase/succinyl-diaminopimelate desuccinylase-like protein
MTVAGDKARAYAQENGDRFVEELLEMLRIPSVGADPAFAADTRRNAEWLAAHLASLGLDNACVMETAGHPVVYAEWLGAGPDKRTVLVYGHYDVVPAKMEDGWDTDPFDPVIKDGKIFGRGTTDDKGQLFIHAKALESFLKTSGAAPVNVKILLEGEEEVSSPNLVPWIQQHKDLINADVCVISDSSMRVIEEPAITHSLRGMTYIEVEVQGPREDLHSGFWGGATHNPALALVEILGKLYNDDGTIAVPGFYDDVVPLTEAERAMLAKISLTDEQFMAATGVPAVWGDKNYTIRERVSARPTLDINGLWSGYSGPGPKTIIPVRAGAKISSRLVGNQDPHKIFELLKKAIEDASPPTVKVGLLAHVDTAPQFAGTGRPPDRPSQLRRRRHRAARRPRHDPFAQGAAVSRPESGRRHRDRLRQDAAGRGRQGGRRHHHGGRTPSARKPGHPPRPDPHRLHLRRGNRTRRARRPAARPGADVAYTLDGAARGEIVYETFSADAAKIRIKGVSIHPGWAKDKLVNATHLAAKIVGMLPQATLTPETTSGRQGFLHVSACMVRPRR